MSILKHHNKINPEVFARLLEQTNQICLLKNLLKQIA